MKNLFLSGFVNALLTSSLALAATSKPATAAEKKAIIQSIKLNDYLKNIDKNQTVEKMSSTGKGKADIFILFNVKPDGGKTLSMQLFDLNRDGNIDLVKVFEKGKLTKTEADLDYDGIVDVVSEYDTFNGELKKKLQADGATNIWKYYFKNELRRKEIDRNSDGKPDMWVYYRNGKVIRTEIDQNFTGKIVRVEGSLTPGKEKK